MKVGVITDCFKVDTATAIKEAAKLGLSGVQIYATTGSFSPDSLTGEDIEFYKKLLKENNLVISALCADMGGFGFEIEKDNAERVEKTKKIVDLAVKFNCKVLTTHIGVIPADKSVPRYKVMLNALNACGAYAKSKGVTMAIETGPEIAPTLKAFLDDTTGGVGVNLDPANFAMVTGQNPVEAVYLLKDYIVHTHLKDGIRKGNPVAEKIYHAFAVGGVEGMFDEGGFEETPVGEGSVDFKNYIKALKDIGYDGFLTIEREVGPNPAEDIKKAKDYIEKFI